MRKRLIAALLCAALLVALGSRRPDENVTLYKLYFLEADLASAPGRDALRAEEVHLDTSGSPSAQELAEQLLQALLAGPIDSTLTAVIPADTALISLELEGTWAKVDLSTRYRMLSGVELALADYAITLTLTQLPEISAVSITVRGMPLAYRDRQTFTARDVLFASNEDVIGLVPATLYVFNAEGQMVPWEVTLDQYEGETQVGTVVKALLGGFEEQEYRSPLPDGFQVTSVRLEEDTCYVDLPTAALSAMPEDAQLDAALQALADSLLSLQAVAEVRYLVDGEYAAVYGSAPVMEPYTAEA